MMGILSRLLKKKETINCANIVEWVMVESNVFQGAAGYAIWSPVDLQPGDLVYYGSPQRGEGVYAVVRAGKYIYKDDGFNPKNYEVVGLLGGNDDLR